ncbi:MAG: glycoside hydrolase family 3 C-terminal domain-containing protein, partial [Propionibacteriaceae bacterium]|nr:glycoside hydrolase family 3 C-terminal domain-containing protein [Propionibacteriaceae bacterium]
PPQRRGVQQPGAIAREIGAQMAVLLKNDNAILPISKDAGRIVIIGQSKYAEFACQGGGGSSRVDPLYTVDPLPGFRAVLAELGGTATVDAVIVASDLSNIDEAIAAAKDADVVVIMAGLVATEGADLPDLHLPNDQDRLIAEIAPVNPNTALVLKNSSPVLMPWAEAVPAILEVWNQGTEDGHVVPDLLLGAVNPSGKVPTTYPRTAEDTLVAGRPDRYPGTDEGAGYPVIRYSEGLRMGYRWHQAEGIAPQWAFGFGLSYTTFEITEATVDPGATPGGSPVTVQATVANTGVRPGAEVVQVYLGFPQHTGQPPKRLVGFAKVTVEPGATQQVTIVIDPEATHHPLSVWSYGERGWTVPHGEFTVFVGTSSENTPIVERFTVG